MSLRPAPGQVTAILLAAGGGERVGEDLPKQFLDLGGRPMFVHALLAMEEAPGIDSVVVVLPERRPGWVEREVSTSKVISITSGGSTRQDSLREGLVCIPEEASSVLIHDAARPLVDSELIGRVLTALDGTVDGAFCALPVDDALKEVGPDGIVLSSRPRTYLWRAQTPQAFSREALEDSSAWAEANGIVCDDCSEMAVRRGYRVRVVAGEPWNLKVTSLSDLRLCEQLLGARGSSGVSAAPGS